MNAGGGQRSVCLGYNALREEQAAIRAMPPKAYLARMDDETDACDRRRAALRAPRRPAPPQPGQPGYRAFQTRG
jgi:hypothetical protein